MDLIPFGNTTLDHDTVQHIEITESPDGNSDLVRLFPMKAGGPIEFYLDSDAAIALATLLGLKSDPER